jgi:hypothetical protein
MEQALNRAGRIIRALHAYFGGLEMMTEEEAAYYDMLDEWIEEHGHEAD